MINNMEIIKYLKYDCGLQRCVPSPDVLNALNLKWGQFYSLPLPNCYIICKLQCTSEFSSLPSGYLHYDDSVYIPRKKYNDKPEEIRRLNLDKSLRSIKVTVVLKDSKQISKYQQQNKTRLLTAIYSTLSQFAILRNCRVKCNNIPCCSVLGIEMLIIDELDIEEYTVVIANEASKIKINTVTSKDRLEDLQVWQSEKCIERNVFTLLCGPSGTGKTVLVTKVASDLGIPVIKLICSDVCRPYPGESEQMLQELFQSAEEECSDGEGKCVLFLDEIECVGSRENQTAARVCSELQRLLDKVTKCHGLSVIAATNRPNLLSSALKRRFGREILLRIPNSQQRQEIIKILTASVCHQVGDSIIDFHQVALSTPGYTGADLKFLCEHVTKQSLKNKIPLTTDIFIQTLKEFRPASRKTNSDFYPDLDHVQWEDIGGLEDAKEKLWQMIEMPLTNPEIMAHYGLPNSKGILLYGPPGCCKTTLVKAAANNLKVSFLSIVPSRIYSAFLGESERAIREVFQRARACAPAILFIDELDGLVGSRTKDSHGGVPEKVLSTLLNEMDGIGSKVPESENSTSNVLVICATNRPDLIDPALLRPGRIDAMLYIPPPDFEARKHILEVHTRNKPLKNVNIAAIAGKTDLFSGADLEALCREATLSAMVQNGMDVEWIEEEHFKIALAEMSPSLTEKQLEFYNHFSSFCKFKKMQ